MLVFLQTLHIRHFSDSFTQLFVSAKNLTYFTEKKYPYSPWPWLDPDIRAVY